MLVFVTVQAFSSCGEGGHSLAEVRGLLIAASLVAGWAQGRGLGSYGSWALKHRLSSWGAQAQLPRSMWDLPRPGIEPVTPSLAGGFFITEPAGKPLMCF